MTRKTEEQRLEEARSHFYAYRFREAYSGYRRVFSTLPFNLAEAYLEHIGAFCRTLIELGRIEELGFYVPVLEKYYEKDHNPHVGYALAYVLFCLGSKARAKALFEKVRSGQIPSDLRIKTLMMLAHITSDESEKVLLIHAVSGEAEDPHLAKLLEVWRCIALKYQGKAGEAITRLTTLIKALDAQTEFWYSAFSARDALVRSYLHVDRFSEARLEIEKLSSRNCAVLSRTTARHVNDLNEFYRGCLSRQSIVARENRGATQLTFKGESVQIKNEPMRVLVKLFQKNQVMTMRKISESLSLAEERIEELQERFTEKLMTIALPADSIFRKGSSLQLVPALKSAASFRSIGE